MCVMVGRIPVSRPSSSLLFVCRYPPLSPVLVPSLVLPFGTSAPLVILAPLCCRVPAVCLLGSGSFRVILEWGYVMAVSRLCLVVLALGMDAGILLS
jgi:hypothetical protein